MKKIDVEYLIKRLKIEEKLILVPLSENKSMRWKDVIWFRQVINPIFSERMLQEFNWVKMGMNTDVDVLAELIIITSLSFEEVWQRMEEENFCKEKVLEIEKKLKENE